MSFYKKYLAYKLEQKRWNLSEAQGLANVQLNGAEQEVPISASSSSSSPGTFSSCSFNVSVSATPSVLFSGNLDEEFAAGIPSGPQNPPSVLLFPRAMTESPQSQPEGNRSHENEGPKSHQELGEIKSSLLEEALFGKMADVVGFLLSKYRSREPTTEAEIQSRVLTNYEDFFPVIFSQACECLQLIFGIEVQDTVPQGHSYVLVATLDSTADDTEDPEQTMPRTGLLVMVLAAIVLEGDCCSEDKVWDSLRWMGVHPGREHFIYGEPRELLTNVWVQEQYLEYRQVSGSCPAHYVFLWGPRAHAETNKRKILELWDRVTRLDPRCFLALCEMNEEMM